MILLKYSPLFFIYYIIRPYEKRDILKSILFNIFVVITIGAIISSSEKQEYNNEVIINEQYKISNQLAIPVDFNSDLNDINSENKDLFGKTEDLSKESNKNNNKNDEKDDTNDQISTIKTYLENIHEKYKVDKSYILFSWWLISEEDTNDYINIVPRTILNKYTELDNIVEVKKTNEVLDFLINQKYDINIQNIFNTISEKQLNQNQYNKINEIISDIQKRPNSIYVYNAGDSLIDSIVKTYIRATDSENKLDNFKLEVIKEYPDNLQKIRSINGLSYYWQNQIYHNLNNREKKQITGPLGEVGYKKLFPIFIQGDPVDRISKLGWKFNGKKTTLGESACSLYSLCSLIHAAGYGENYIPGTKELPTMQNLKKYFTNGPITGVHVNQYYDVKFRSTATKEGQDEIFNDLMVGIPYVVNVRSGVIKAYKPDGSIDNTIFTSRGHFMIMESAKVENNLRLVSLVQSSRSNASLWGLDQNNAWFDYDEIIKKGVLKSSAGISVPAYTIIGGENLPTPIYLSNDYDKIKDKSIRANKLIEHKEDNKWLKEFVTNFGMDINKSMENGSPLKEEQTIKINRPVVVGYMNDDVIIFITKDNAVLLTNITDKSNIEGKRKPNAIIGKTTKYTKAYIVQKADNGWEIVRTGSTLEERDD